MAVAVLTSAKATGAAGSASGSINCTGASHVYLFTAWQSTHTISSISCGGVAGTSVVGGSSSENVTVYIHRVTSPGTGSQTFSVTLSGSTDVSLYALAVSGVNAGSPEEDTDASTGLSLTLTSRTGGLVIDHIISKAYLGDPNLVVGAGQTMFQETDPFVNWCDVAASYEAGATSVTMSWTNGGSPQYHVACSLVPAPPTDQAIFWW